ncbi:MAG: TRAP transporter substrate-binding protein [Alphaproteobacteria bacterium]|nr:TRAP transporter substrate-binding protein [Alphaproteobacteria bacterium]
MRSGSWQRLAASVGAIAIAGTLAVQAQAQTVLRFSHTDTATGARQKAAELFAKQVEEGTQGRYKVQVFHSGQLANDPKAIEQLQLGGVDFTVSGTGSYAPHVKTLNLTALPYLVDGYAQGWKLYDESKWLQAQFDLLPAKGLRILATWEAGFRSFTTKEPLGSPADAKGKKMRVFPNDMIRWIMESIGFTPVVLPVTEVYLAIQQGTVIGQENPIDTINSLRFYEVAPYITLTQHVYSPIPLAVSERTWQKLSQADQAAIVRAAQAAAKFSREEVRANDQRLLDEMTAKGAKVSRPDIAAFRKAASSVYEKARGTYGADVDAILADTEAVRKALPSN